MATRLQRMLLPPCSLKSFISTFSCRVVHLKALFGLSIILNSRLTYMTQTCISRLMLLIKLFSGLCGRARNM